MNASYLHLLVKKDTLRGKCPKELIKWDTPRKDWIPPDVLLIVRK